MLHIALGIKPDGVKIEIHKICSVEERNEIPIKEYNGI